MELLVAMPAGRQPQALTSGHRHSVGERFCRGAAGRIFRRRRRSLFANVEKKVTMAGYQYRLKPIEAGCQQ